MSKPVQECRQLVATRNATNYDLNIRYPVVFRKLRKDNSAVNTANEIIKIACIYNKNCCADTALFLLLHLLITANRAASLPIQVVNARSSLQRLRPKVVSEAVPSDVIPYNAAENKNTSYDYI